MSFREQRARVTALLLALCAACCCASCASDDSSIPVTKWSILYNDAQSIDAIGAAAAEWKPVSVPSTFKLPYRRGKGLQYAWLSGEFELRGDPSAYYGISLGRIYYTDRVYINGKLVGEKEPRDINIMCRNRSYAIPGGTLRPGLNNVHVLIGTFPNEYAGVLSPVMIQEEARFSQARILGDLIYIYIPVSVIIVASFMLLLLAIFYLWNRTEKQFLYSSFGIIIYIFYLASLFYPFRNVDFLVIRFMHAATVPFFSIALILIIQSMYGIHLTNYNRILVPALLGVIVLDFLSLLLLYRADVPATHYASDILSFITICVTAPLSVYLTVKLDRLKPDRFKRYISLLGAVAMNLVIFIETILSATGGRLAFLLATFCSPFFFIMFAAFYAREVTRKNAELNHLYDRLKEDEPVINETTQEKLDKVMQFIRENYTSDLSREGLAAAVGLNPNYMSTLFRKYTGYKINDYINKLRIEDAAAKLAKRDEKIIEIAFAVGFESLTTFNRVFKSVLGKTPTEYREMA
jgi:AraC-like DNA-binding protein